MTDMQKAEKEITSLTEDEVEVSTESLGVSRYSGIHLILVTRMKIKVGLGFCRLPKHVVSMAG